jgi:hypothetical protein
MKGKKTQKRGRGSFNRCAEEEKNIYIYIYMMKEYGTCLQMDGTWLNCISQGVDVPHELKKKKCELKLIG